MYNVILLMVKKLIDLVHNTNTKIFIVKKVLIFY